LDGNSGYDPKRRKAGSKFRTAASPDLIVGNQLCCQLPRGQRMHLDRTNRREFITLLSGVIAAWPLAARAQQPKRIGVLMDGVATSSVGQTNLSFFVQGLRKLGWIDGENIRIEVRWNAGDRSLIEAYGSDLVGLFKPDVLLAASTANLAALQRATSTIPIVFTTVSDPVAQGFVPNLTRPGGNITGFANPEFSIAGKWADLLKQMAPSITRVALVFNLETSPQSKLFVHAAEAAAQSLGVEVIAAPVHTTEEIETTLLHFSHEPNIGLVFPIGVFIRLRAKLIVETVARYRLPAIYADEAFMPEGGLMSYHNDWSEQYRLAPFYVDRILKGTKPGDLAVQLPKTFRFIVNRKTASALGIDVPLGLLLAADDVIE
jgi:putative ABC transport system substrate-binding protein